MINVISEASSLYRTEDKRIFNGFGLVHNQVIDEYLPQEELPAGGMVLISQTIGEAAVLLMENLEDMTSGFSGAEDIKYTDSLGCFLQINANMAWKQAGIINEKVGFYRAVIKGSNIIICAYDNGGRALPSKMDFPKQYSKYLPIVAAMFALDLIRDEKTKELFNFLLKEPSEEMLARLYARFYLRHKMDKYYIFYDMISPIEFKNAPSVVDDIVIRNMGPAFALETGNTSLVGNNQDLAGKVGNLGENGNTGENPASKYTDPRAYTVSKFLKEDFIEEYRSLIPVFGKEFIFPEKLYNLSSAISQGDIRSVLFHGPAGTGKTMACKLIAELINMPIMDTVNCTENLDEFVLGKYVPEGSEIIFKESYVAKAIRYGGAVVFEEINFAKPQYLAFLNSLLDDNGFVRLDNGEIIKRHKNFRFFATMNIGYFGTKELNQALYNRFQAVIEISELSDDAIRTMLVERVPDCAGFVDDALKLYHQVKDKIKREELDIVISPRNLENWMRLCKYESIEEAAEKTIVPIAKGDRDLEIDLKLMIKQSKWR